MGPTGKLIAAGISAMLIIMFSFAVVWEISLSVEQRARSGKIKDAKTELRVAKLQAEAKRTRLESPCERSSRR